MTAEEKAALEATNARLASELKAANEQLAAAAAAQVHATHVAFADGLVAEARLLPAWRDVAVATLDHLATQPEVVQFGEGTAKAPLTAGLMAMFKALPKQITEGETATSERAGAPAETVAFAAPQSYSVDAAAAALHSKALAYQAKHKVPYVDAVSAVQAGQV